MTPLTRYPIVSDRTAVSGFVRETGVNLAFGCALTISGLWIGVVGSGYFRYGALLGSCIGLGVVGRTVYILRKAPCDLQRYIYAHADQLFWS